jgi:hypothetical protein
MLSTEQQAHFGTFGFIVLGMTAKLLEYGFK